jgi:DNA-directed RNA polymerase specialized sigma24 family protein
MTDIPPTLSVPPERPIDPPLLDALQRIDSGMRSLARSYLAGDARAWDLMQDTCIMA